MDGSLVFFTGQRNRRRRLALLLLLWGCTLSVVGAWSAGVQAKEGQIPVLTEDLGSLHYWIAQTALNTPQITTLTQQRQRELFIAAKELIDNGELKGAEALIGQIDQLGSYPLRPYLDYFYLALNLSRVQAAQIEHFSQQYHGDFLAKRLQFVWLRHLAERSAWKEFLQVDNNASQVDLQCYRAQALSHVGRVQEADELGLVLWRHGRSRPKSCDLVFTRLENRRLITRERIWERIELAVEAGENSLARYLAKKLELPQDKERFKRYIAAVAQPDKELAALVAAASEDEFERKLLQAALFRLARIDPEASYKYIAQLPVGILPDKVLWVLKNRTVLFAALSFHPQAVAWMNAIPKENRTAIVSEWMVRAALRQQQWSLVLAAIEQLPETVQTDSEWEYWQARALEELGMETLAKEKMVKLAAQRSYYGFMAADRLGLPYNMNDSSPLFVKSEQSDLQSLHRLQELRVVGLERWARLEWQHVIQHLNEDEKQIAALVAHDAGWHDLVFLTAGATGLEDNLQLRFPFAYREEVEKAVTASSLDPAWVMGLMRRESAFRADARSAAGAMGLMQVMPATGRQVAKKLKSPLKKVNELLAVERNIEIGSAYLESLSQRFNQNMVLATAAYNAGPNNVTRWLPQQSVLPADVWIDTIPFRETREYTRAVLSYAVVFGWRLRGEALPLRNRYGVIAAPLLDEG